MEVDLRYYLEHYFDTKEFLSFFLMSLGILFVFFVGLYIYTLICSRKVKRMLRREYVRIEWHVLVQRFYEILFSGTSILFFMAVYYLIDRFVVVEPYRSYWDRYSDFILLILILMSCAFVSLLDKVLVKLNFLNKDEHSAGKLTGMVYMLLIFCYIKFIYENNNYDMFITYFLGLMIGRFAYFDSSMHDFVKSIDGVRKNLLLMLCALAYTAIICLYGFSSDYLLVHNGVITNVFIAHLFICASIFILHHLHIAELVTGRGTRVPRIPDQPREYEEQDFSEDDFDYNE